MLYGNNSSSGNVLELRFETAAGFELYLASALFGGFSNTARYVSYQLFSDDYAQSSDFATILTGANAPTMAVFPLGFANAVRLQFTETDDTGVASGRGAFDVGIQDIQYAVRSANTPPTSVPEPGSFALLATAIAFLGVASRRRRRVGSA